MNDVTIIFKGTEAQPKQMERLLGLPITTVINECSHYENIYIEAILFINKKGLMDEFNQWNEPNRAKR